MKWIRYRQFINAIRLVVNDYDEAIDFYVNKLDFELIEDTRLSEESYGCVVVFQDLYGNKWDLLQLK